MSCQESSAGGAKEFSPARQSQCENRRSHSEVDYECRKSSAVGAKEFSPARSRNRGPRFALLLRELGWEGGVLGRVEGETESCRDGRVSGAHSRPICFGGLDGRF